jgi:hypothetical protein
MINCVDLNGVKFRDLLSRVVSVCDRDRFISKNIYHYGEGYYLIVGNAVSDGDYFIRSILWASSGAAARRAVNQEFIDLNPKSIEDIGFIIYDFSVSSYADLIDYFKFRLKEKVIESASYHLDDGIFVHKKIETKKYIFFFSETEVSGSEHPYAILFKLGKN